MRSAGDWMLVSFKDAGKLLGIVIVAACAVFVCHLFLNYQLDLTAIQDNLLDPAAITMAEAHITSGQVTIVLSGGCLSLTTMILLMFYITNYIDSHRSVLGILKAMGYGNLRIALHFWVFGFGVLLGCALGFLLATLYLPTLYQAQNAQQLFPDFSPQFHPICVVILVFLPALLYFIIAIVYAAVRLNRPVLQLLHQSDKQSKHSNRLQRQSPRPFLQELRHASLRSNKVLAFFVGFSAFCFSAMLQMAISMNELASESFAGMMLLIGLILAFMTLFLALSSLMKGNQKTMAMMRVMGYNERECAYTILHVYRPISYIGFLIGTLYQYLLLKTVMRLVFADIAGIPAYHFDIQTFWFTLALFLITYELILFLYARRMRHLSLKSIMLE